MTLPDKLLEDALLRKVIYTGVILIIGACVISQVLMQFGGGIRDEPMDLSSHLPADSQRQADDAVIFENGLPPFISSGGLFYPEKAVFDIGLGLGGLLTILLSADLFLRTKSGLKASGGSRWRQGANVGQLVTGIIIGGSLVMLTRNPFNVALVAHIFYAMNIFYGSFIWGAFIAFSRKGLDSELKSVGGYPLSTVRWGLVLAGFASFQAMMILLAYNFIYESAFFEWALTFAGEAQVLTIIPILSSVVSDEEE